MKNAFTAVLAAGAIGSVLAQSSANSSVIPSGISSGCSSFLTSTLEPSTSALSTCFNSIIEQTTSESTDLDQFCSNTASSCTESTTRKVLTSFYDACSAELITDDNQDVIKIYDDLYALTPMRNGMCTKDDQGKYCLSSMGSKYLNGQTSAVQTILDGATISGDDWSKYGIAFGFLNANLGKDTLCQSCTRKIITAYTTFETSVAYAPGLSLSPLLSSQTEIYKAVQSQCGSDYLTGAVGAVGNLGGGSTDVDGALSTSVSRMVTALAVMAVGLVAIA